VAHDTLLGAHMEVGLNELGKLFSNVGVHVEVLLPGFLSCVAVVSCSVSNSPVIVNLKGFVIGGVVWDVTWASVREDDGYAVLFSVRGVT